MQKEKRHRRLWRGWRLLSARPLYVVDQTDLGCGPITVTVTRANGTNVPTDYPVTRNYDFAAPPSCSNAYYQNRATFELFRGQAYTWKAACTARQWTGTIQVPCEEDQCHLIQLQ
jgi:hypothetical protein